MLLGEVLIFKGFLFLIDVLYILNVVAIDFKNRIFICKNNNVVYIVFYLKKYYYSININDISNLHFSLKHFLIDYNINNNDNDDNTRIWNFSALIPKWLRYFPFYNLNNNTNKKKDKRNERSFV